MKLDLIQVCQQPACIILTVFYFPLRYCPAAEHEHHRLLASTEVLCGQLAESRYINVELQRQVVELTTCGSIVRRSNHHTVTPTKQSRNVRHLYQCGQSKTYLDSFGEVFTTVTTHCSVTMVQVTSESQLATMDSHGREQCNTSLTRDPVVYSNPFDPVL